MTLDEMCISAARYSDRYDEFEKTLEGGTSTDPEDWYEDDALHYFRVFTDAINEAYYQVSREFAMPDKYLRVVVGEDGIVDLNGVAPAVCSIRNVFTEDRSATADYRFETKYAIQMRNLHAGDFVTLYYHYLPEKLFGLNDTPVFSEAAVDPMVYITLAVARMWLSEKKLDYYNAWMQQYYTLIRNVRSSLTSRAGRRIPRGLFR